MIDLFVEFRRDVVRRRTEFDLRKAEHGPTSWRPQDRPRPPRRGDRAHPRLAQPGRGARRLVAAFGCRHPAQAILDMQLQRLTGLERQKIEDELAEVLKTIERLRAILASERLLMEIVVARAARGAREVPDAAGPRSTTRVASSASRTSCRRGRRDHVTHTGYVKRTAVTNYRTSSGAQGPHRMRFREEDFVDHLFIAPRTPT